MLRLVLSIEPGRLVSLKSGGPAMTVKSVAGGKAECVWFDAQDNLHGATFPVETIQLHRAERVVLRVAEKRSTE